MIWGTGNTGPLAPAGGGRSEREMCVENIRDTTVVYLAGVFELL